MTHIDVATIERERLAARDRMTQALRWGADAGLPWNVRVRAARIAYHDLESAARFIAAERDSQRGDTQSGDAQRAREAVRRVRG